MRIIPLADCLKMDDGERVPAVCVKIDKIWDRNTGENSNGPWSLQNVTVVDPKNKDVKMKAKFGNCEPIPKNWLGKTIIISSTKSDRVGMVGVKIKDDSYTKKGTNELVQQLVIDVTSQAEYGPAESMNQTQQPPPPAEDQGAGAEDPPPPTQQTQQPPPPAQGGRSFAAIKGMAKEAANLYLIAFESAGYVNATQKIRTGADMSPEQFQGCCSSIYITLDRAGGRDVVPVIDMREAYQKAASKTQPPKPPPPPPAQDEDDVPM